MYMQAFTHSILARESPVLSWCFPIFSSPLPAAVQSSSVLRQYGIAEWQEEALKGYENNSLSHKRVAKCYRNDHSRVFNFEKGTTELLESQMLS